MTGYSVANCGEPGQVVPYRKEYLEWFSKDVQKHQPELLVIMLGTNEQINMPVPDAGKTAVNMEQMIRYAKHNQLSKEILLLSCPGVYIEGGFFFRLCRISLTDTGELQRGKKSVSLIRSAGTSRWPMTGSILQMRGIVCLQRKSVKQSLKCASFSPMLTL